MTDEESVSDWGSVTDENFSYDSKEENNKKQTATNKVVVELPPEGIKSSQQSVQVSNPPPLTSSVASSFVRDIGALDIKKKSDDASSLSSFVPVARIERNADFPAADASSWSQVSSQPPAQLSFAASGWMSTNSSTVGSVASNFDIISLVSGQTIMRCKRCKFHNPSQTNICNSCDLALTANPCIDVDQQIAMALQEKEEREALSLLVDQEQKRGQFEDESLFSQSTFLAQEILTYVKKYSNKAHFRTLLEYDMKLLAAEFIKVVSVCGQNFRVSLAYKFTSSNQDTWNAIRSRGFATNPKLGSKGLVKVSQNIEAALTSYHMDSISSIPEEHGDESDTTPSRVTGWIVALIESPYKYGAMENTILISGTTVTMKTVKYAEQVLPLACFDAQLKDSDGIQRLANGLSRFCRDFFGSGLDSETTAIPQLFPGLLDTSSGNESDGLLKCEDRMTPTLLEELQVMTMPQLESILRSLGTSDRLIDKSDHRTRLRMIQQRCRNHSITRNELFSRPGLSED